MISELLEHLEPRAHEWLAHTVAERRIGPIQVRSRIVCGEPCWRLGAVIVDRSGTFYATGTVLVTEPEQMRGYTSQLSRERAELQAAARRGRIPDGRVLDLDVQQLALENPTPPLRIVGGELQVEWARSAWIALEPYLWERANLLPLR